MLASGGDDRTVRLWDVAGTSCIVSLRVGEPGAALAAVNDAIALTLGRDVCCLGTVDPDEHVGAGHSASD